MKQEKIKDMANQQKKENEKFYEKVREEEVEKAIKSIESIPKLFFKSINKNKVKK